YATPARALELERELGLQGSFFSRYWTWLTNVLAGDFGRSYSFDRPVLDLVLARLGPTLLLALTALGIGTLLGLLLGSVAAVRRGHLADRALTLVALVGISTPPFWMAMLLMVLFAVELGLFPVSGMVSAFGAGAGGVLDIASHLVLPALALALVVL